MRKWIVIAPPLLAAVLIWGCATQRPIARISKRSPSIDMLQQKGDTLGWSGIDLGMTRSDLRSILGTNPALAHIDNPERCGDYYSRARVAGRDLYIQWSSGDETARIEVIGVPLSRAERSMTASELSESVLQRLPGLADGAMYDYRVKPRRHPTYLVVDRDPDLALLLKPAAPDGSLYVSYAECLD